MACALSGNSCSISASAKLLFNKSHLKKRQFLQYAPRIRASADDAEDCNTEECAPDKEVGKVSMEWLAGEKTRVVGTFPPRNKGWTGYVEKDTAGQTNIYSVEIAVSQPAVYIAESAISSGSAGSSADGSENTAAVVGGIALISIAAASLVLFQVSKAPPVVQTVDYSGPSLSYYINKFTPPATVEASAPSVTEGSTPLQTETSSQPEVLADSQQETTPSGSNVS
ncbi:proline-rich family protein [Perilla frutescens var. hirtella]|nr:proline-rich family protein [Perilla frutescens var. frutescens]KAH6794301.1 proline-rich family protein [Perilla frutescens var. hirtella]